MTLRSRFTWALKDGGVVGQVAQEEVGGVHQEAALLLGHDGQGGQHRAGEGLLHRPDLLGVPGAGDHAGVLLDQEDPGAVALEVSTRDPAEEPRSGPTVPVPCRIETMWRNSSSSRLTSR
jgi:hypothetical protein